MKISSAISMFWQAAYVVVTSNNEIYTMFILDSGFVCHCSKFNSQPNVLDRVS